MESIQPYVEMAGDTSNRRLRAWCLVDRIVILIGLAPASQRNTRGTGRSVDGDEGKRVLRPGSYASRFRASSVSR